MALPEVPGVEMLSAVSDQLGRPGRGFAELDAGGNHREIVFGDDYELLGYQVTLLNPDWDYARRGTLISWTAYLARQWADQLPPDAPSISHHDYSCTVRNTRDRPPARMCVERFGYRTRFRN